MELTGSAAHTILFTLFFSHRIQRIPQTVTDELEGQHRDCNQQAGADEQMERQVSFCFRVAQEEKIVGPIEHSTPGSGRRLYAQSQKAVRRFLNPL